MDETLPPSKDQFTPVQRLSHIKEANLWSLEDLEQALRKMNANVQSGHQKGSLQQEKAAKLLAVGLSLINQCRLRREAGESMPESPVAGELDGRPLHPLGSHNPRWRRRWGSHSSNEKSIPRFDKHGRIGSIYNNVAEAADEHGDQGTAPARSCRRGPPNAARFYCNHGKGRGAQIWHRVGAFRPSRTSF